MKIEDEPYKLKSKLNDIERVDLEDFKMKSSAKFTDKVIIG